MSRRAFVNAHRRSDADAAPPDLAASRFHQSRPDYRPTPVRALTELADELGLRTVDVKDESDRFGLPAFKVLGASWAVEQVLRHHPDTRAVVAASAGNHGRAVARCAAERSLACLVLLPDTASPARAAAIESEGASVRHVRGGYDAAVTAALAAARPGTALISDTATDATAPTPRWVSDGYHTMFRELDAQLAATPHVILVPIGVGSLASAAVRWAEPFGGRVHVIGVEPTTAACVTESLRRGRPTTVATPGTTMSGLDCATPSAVAWPVLRRGLSGTVTVDDAEVHAAMRTLAGQGMRIGDCGAAPVAALRRLVLDPACAELRRAVGLGPDSRIVCLATEGVTDPASYQACINGWRADA